MRLLVPSLIVLAVLVAWRIVRRQRTYYVMQYLFFVRFPLTIGAVLMLLPLTAGALPSMLRNLFELDAWGLGVVTFFTALCAWSVAYTGLLIWKSTPLRVGLRLEKETDAAWRAGRAPLAALDVNVLSERHARAALVLALPMAVTLWRYAGTGPWWAALWILIGVAVAMGVRWMSGVIADREPAVIRKWIDATHEERPPASGLWAAYELCPKDLEDRDTLRPSYRRLHWRASMFALTASGLGLRSPIES